MIGSSRRPPHDEGVSVQEYLEIFKKEGQVTVPSPDGMGTYTIFMTPGHYYVPRLVWQSFVRDDHDRYSPSFLKTNQGREILWYPKGLGARLGTDAMRMYPDRTTYYVAMAKMVIGFILSGRQLYALRCGANINSLNNNENQNRPSY